MTEFSCYDCIHCDRCNDIESGVSHHCADVSKCKHFKNKDDLVPMSEYTKLQNEVNRLKKYDEERDIALHARLIENAKSEAAQEIIDSIKANSSSCVMSHNGQEIYETKSYTINAYKLDDLLTKYKRKR